MENPERAVGGIAVRTPPGIELRPLGRDDLHAAVSLARELHGHPPLTEMAQLQRGLDALINSVDAVPFVAIEEAEPVGLGILHFRRRLNVATFEGWVSDLYVRTDARRRGIGRALLEALVAEWRLRGSHWLEAKAPTGAAAAAGLFTSAGMEEWMHNFRLRPVGGSPAPTADTVLIRPTAPSDEGPVTAVLAEFGPGRTPAAERMDAVQRIFAAHLADAAAGRAYSRVAEVDGEAVGFCCMEWQRPFWTDEVHAWMPDLIVRETHRGRGIGRALLADALAHAAAADAAQVSLESGPQRMAAHALYRSTGFDEIGRTFLLRR
jgi:GNAT superfamily N-acetyltransferase